VTSGADPDTSPAYHYSLDQTDRVSQGRVVVTSTGRANGVYETVSTVLGEDGASDYVYYTDFESADPDNVVAYPNWTWYSSWARSACGGGPNGYLNALHWWEGRGAAGCVEITFVGGDVLAGKVFTNDTILGTQMSGLKPSFQRLVTTAEPGCQTPGATNSAWENNCLRSGAVANFNGIQPAFHSPDYLNDTTAAFSTYPGCQYHGATRIIFSGTTMRVWNRSSVNGGTAPTIVADAQGNAPSTCGTGTDINGQVIPIPQNMVIYVADSIASPGACSTGEIDGTLPRSGDVTTSQTSKRCEKGNLYVQGPYSGAVTLATSQSIVVTGDLVRSNGDAGSDMLGLVAQNSVEIYHPVNSWGSEIASVARYTDPDTGSFNPSSGIQVAASIQTLQHSFFVQQFNRGTDRGTLLVVGSIAQRWRGAVGTSGGTGYLKSYQYNSDLSHTLPPYLPRWKDSHWSIRYTGEISTPSAVKA
jgi:hypothetical protein